MKNRGMKRMIGLLLLGILVFFPSTSAQAQEARSVETESTIVFSGRYPYPSEPVTPTPPSGPQAKPPSTGNLPQTNEAVSYWEIWLGLSLVLLVGIILFKRRKQIKNNG